MYKTDNTGIAMFRHPSAMNGRWMRLVVAVGMMIRVVKMCRPEAIHRPVVEVHRARTEKIIGGVRRWHQRRG